MGKYDETLTRLDEVERKLDRAEMQLLQRTALSDELKRRINVLESRAVMRQQWYAQPNDLIGGWCVTNVDKAPSAIDAEQGEREIADVFMEEAAHEMARLHNESL